MNRFSDCAFFKLAIKSLQFIKYVEFLFWAASIPIEVAKCVFPTPGLPTKIIFSLFSINLKFLKSNIYSLFNVGWNEKSKSSNVFKNGNPAVLTQP